MSLPFVARVAALVLSLAAVSAPLYSQTLASGIDLKAIDKTSNPCVDFYQYACGSWVKSNPVPPDQSRWGRFNELAERNRQVLRSILEKAADQKGTRTAVDQKIGDYYASCTDQEGIEKKGTAPIQPELERIAKMDGKEALAAEVVRLHSQGTPALFGFSSGQDAKNSSEVIAQLMQGGLSLPDRDYYLKTDPTSTETRTKFLAHVQNMFQLLGHDAQQAASEAKAVLNIETALAKSSLDRVALRNPKARYHRLPTSELSSLAPLFDWRTYMKGLDVSVPTLNIAVPDFLKGVNDAIATSGLDDLKAYLSWHVLHEAAPLLSSKFVNENFQFFEKTLRGAKELQPLWKRCVSLVDRQLGEAVGQKYVQLTFGAEGKQRTLQMVGEIETQMAKDIESLPWMSSATKQQALEKLHGVANKIGYPEHWRDYSNVKIVRGDLVGNDRRADAFEVRRRLAKIGQPVDKLEWGMTPPTVNAYYSPPMNNINFPAGILQPPFYFKGGDEAANYGAIGAVVGHELTHGFDDQGRQYDGMGNLRDWWTAEDAKNFQERTDCLVNEYGNFVAVGDVKLNGKLTLGENAADNGGIRLAYMALMDSLAKHALPKIADYTPQQRFFLAFAQVWCQNQTDESARLQALTDPHSRGEFRANGVVQNMPEFQKAFSCQAGQPMVSANACRVW
jgi:putative endopeptidase